MEIRSGNILATGLLSLIALSGCMTFENREAAPQQASLDQLHASDRAGWRDEIRRRLQQDDAEIPARHLALAMEAFNNRAERSLLLESVWRYLKARKGDGTSLATRPDRELLDFYAETALRDADGRLSGRLERLCLDLRNEHACRND